METSIKCFPGTSLYWLPGSVLLALSLDPGGTLCDRWFPNHLIPGSPTGFVSEGSLGPWAVPETDWQVMNLLSAPSIATHISSWISAGEAGDKEPLECIE